METTRNYPTTVWFGVLGGLQGMGKMANRDDDKKKP